MPLASARQHPENQKENQAGHSSERTVEGQSGGPIAGIPIHVQSPASRIFCLASGGCKLEQTRPWVGLVDLSRIPSGTFLGDVHPASEMTGQNGQNGRFCDITKRPGFLEWRFLGRIKPFLLH